MRSLGLTPINVYLATLETGVSAPNLENFNLEKKVTPERKKKAQTKAEKEGCSKINLVVGCNESAVSNTLKTQSRGQMAPVNWKI